MNTDEHSTKPTEKVEIQTAEEVPVVETATPTEPSRKKKVTKILLTLLVVAVIVAVIVYTAVMDFSGESVSFERILEMLGDNWYYLLVLFGLFAATILAETVKFLLMIHKTTGKFMLGASFKCAALGKFYDYVTPFGAGGQPFQIYYLTKSGVPGGPAGAIPIGSMFFTQFTFFACAIVSFIVGVSEEIVPIYIQILAYFGSFCYIIVSLCLVVFSLLPKVGYRIISWGTKVSTKLRICKHPDKWIAKGNRAIDNNRANMAIIMKSKRVLIVVTLLSFVFNIALASMPYFTLLLFPDALQTAGLTPSWGLWFDITRITFFIYCAITIVPTPGNSGAADGTFYGLFRSVLVSVAGASFTCMMVWRIFSFYSFILLGALVYLVLKIIEYVRKKRTLPLENK